MSWFHRLIHHPATEITVSLFLIVTSLIEGWDTFTEDLAQFNLGVHHGVLLFGTLSLLKGLSEAREARKRLRDGWGREG